MRAARNVSGMGATMTKLKADGVEERTPKRGRKAIFGAAVAAIVLVIATALVTVIITDAVRGDGGNSSSTGMVGEVVSGDGNAVEQAEQRGYRRGLRDAKAEADERLTVRYDQGYAKGFAEGRQAAEDPGGEVGGYQEGYTAGVKAAVEAYEKVIQQAQRIIAQAGQEPVVPEPAVP